MRRRLIGLLLIAAVLAVTSAVSANTLGVTAVPPVADALLLDRLAAAAGGGLRVSYHAGTGRVRFIGTEPGRPLAGRDMALGTGLSAEAAARAFLSEYGALFGLADPPTELIVKGQTIAAAGRTAVRFQQVHRGVPVLGGELMVNLDRAGNVLSANGEISPAPAVDITPALTAAQAQGQALALAAKWYNGVAESLAVSPAELWLFDPFLLGTPGPRALRPVWRVEVRSAELAPIRELVLIDARTGGVALHFNQNPTGKDRAVYDSRNQRGVRLPGYEPTRVEGQIGRAHV